MNIRLRSEFIKADIQIYEIRIGKLKETIRKAENQICILTIRKTLLEELF